MRSTVGPLLVGAGVLMTLVGVLVWSGLFGWFGRLPGDIRVETPGTRFYAPIVSMLVVSVVFSLLISFIRRIWHP